jgi:DNA modification methylase
LISAKQPPPGHRREWYPYYAGYTERFVLETLAIYHDTGSRLIDPWGGSGTTAAACAKQHISAVTVDINPVLSIIAKARFINNSYAEQLIAAADTIVKRAADATTIPDLPDDPLLTWFQPRAVARVRQLEWTFRCEMSSDAQAPHYAPPEPTVDAKTAFFYCVLFSAVRDSLQRFRSSNPTWVRRPGSAHQRLAPSWPALQESFMERVRYFASRLSLLPEHPTPTIITASAGSLPFPNESFNGAVTSPPYATRIDYVRSVLPELAVLGIVDEQVADLRRSSTGTPVVSGRSEELCVQSPHALSLLDAVKSHHTKGSKRYYEPWLRRYLASFQKELCELARVTRNDGVVCIVVQDSYYKDIHIDLQQIVAESAEYAGMTVTDRTDFRVNTLRSRMNPRARLYMDSRHNSESLIVMKKSSTFQKHKQD